MASAVASCTDVPEEAVTLSVTVGKDMEELRRSHQAVARTLFDRAKSDANRFIDEVYRPFVLEKLLREPVFEGKTAVEVLREAIAEPGAGATIELMLVITEAGLRAIDGGPDGKPNQKPAVKKRQLKKSA